MIFRLQCFATPATLDKVREHEMNVLEKCMVPLPDPRHVYRFLREELVALAAESRLPQVAPTPAPRWAR